MIRLECFILSNNFKFSKYDFSRILKNEKLQGILKNIDFEFLDMDNIGDVCVSFIELYMDGGEIVGDSQIEILKKIKAGDKKARAKFIEDNQGLVYKIAKSYNNCGVEFDDLIQEGNYGLMKAIEKFDVNKGFRFSTYAVYWIRSEIRKIVFSNSKVIRVPRYLEGKVSLYKNVREKFINEYDREPSIDELSVLMDLPISEVDFIIHTQMSIVSLDAPIGEDTDSNLEELIDSGVASPEDIFLQKELSPQVLFLLENSDLTSREIEVVKYKFGFYGNTMTLEEVSEIIGVTRERIRQILSKALRKLRKSSNIERLIEFSSNPEESKRYINDIKKYKY